MIEVKILAADATELSSQIAALALLAAGSLPASALPAPAAAIEEPTPPKAARRRSAADKGDEGKAADASASATSTEPAASAPAPSADTTTATASSEGTKQATTYADVQAAVTKLAANKGRDAVIAVFEQFGVDHGNKLTEAQWPEAIAAMTDALDAEALA